MQLDFGVSSAKTSALYARMDALNIKESDLEEQFIFSGGKGGQNTNKVATCVRLTHRPTDSQIKCQSSRHQLLNRYYARILLVEKLEEIQLGEKSKSQQKAEKIRRQKRKRSKRAKEKLLANKKHQATKKENRKSALEG